MRQSDGDDPVVVLFCRLFQSDVEKTVREEASYVDRE